ncbi:hypothetical protein [Actinoplanes sp. NPDC048796]|uniref:hypothetical protein n=1 Tax=unclassified Actinoplanes TaxID=2626549 RepID=UPI0033D49B1A
MSDDTAEGASTDQHVTGVEETGEFTTDKPPTDTTPADGSTNAGINETSANAQEEAPD